MPIHRLNHAVLYVRNVDASVGFYRDVLGFRPLVVMPGAAFLRTAESANDHDLGLFQVDASAAPSAAGPVAVGLYHLAWEVDTLIELQRLADELIAAGALVGKSDHGTTKSLYGNDPDGLEFEICWLVPADFIVSDGIRPFPRPQHLDLPAEIARFGAHLRGGTGLPVPVTV